MKKRTPSTISRLRDAAAVALRDADEVRVASLGTYRERQSYDAWVKAARVFARADDALRAHNASVPT